MKRLIILAVVSVVAATLVIAPVAFAGDAKSPEPKETRFQPEDIVGTWVGTLRTIDGQEYDLEWNVNRIDGEVFTVTTVLSGDELSGSDTGCKVFSQDEEGLFHASSGAIDLETSLVVHCREPWGSYTPTEMTWVTDYGNCYMVSPTTIYTLGAVDFSFSSFNFSKTCLMVLEKQPGEKDGVSATESEDVVTGYYTGSLDSICNGLARYKLRTGLGHLMGDVYVLIKYRLTQASNTGHNAVLLWEGIFTTLDPDTGRLELFQPPPSINYCGAEISFDFSGHWEGDQITDGDYNVDLQIPGVRINNVDIGNWSASEYTPGHVQQLIPAGK